MGYVFTTHREQHVESMPNVGHSQTAIQALARRIQAKAALARRQRTIVAAQRLVMRLRTRPLKALVWTFSALRTAIIATQIGHLFIASRDHIAIVPLLYANNQVLTLPTTALRNQNVLTTNNAHAIYIQDTRAVLPVLVMEEVLFLLALQPFSTIYGRVTNPTRVMTILAIRPTARNNTVPILVQVEIFPYGKTSLLVV